MCKDWSNAIKLGSRRYDQSVTCLADDPQNLASRSNKRHTPGTLSQTNKQAYNQYSSNAQVKLEWKIQPESST